MLHFAKIPKKNGEIWRKFSKILAKFANFWEKTAKFQQFLTKILRLESGVDYNAVQMNIKNTMKKKNKKEAQTISVQKLFDKRSPDILSIFIRYYRDFLCSPLSSKF